MDAFGLILNVNNFGCEVGFGCEVFEILAGCWWLWVVFAGSGWFGSFLLLVCTKALQFSQTQSENDLAWTQRMPQEPVKVGIRAFVLVDSQIG